LKEHWKFHHTGIVVRDLEKAVEDYRSLGILYNVSERFVAEGKSAKLLGYFIRIGTLNIELWQPVRGDTVQQQFLDECGEGVNHVCFTTDQYDEDYAELTQEQGLSVVFEVNPPGAPGHGAAYFDTRKRGHNVLLELISPWSGLKMPDWLA
jgi:catechol 2,3-dioxygenase-like lactoylglutathione lyase family enzyme